ncbi:RNA polymerase sigma factor [Actinomadura sp. WMMB 499]|uniref:RNA polymerase sigma factor n=1 Tax=Actinomadura sp. WMMB 499 TaxID=1219491 RepID=UPI00124873FA|nr:RNA polymerase sigma factor [Actinomadura sp. WMMB 499]QFG26675.1 RNA polymerase sigma factor [Actinomadura sp. WMMB 499]
MPRTAAETPLTGATSPALDDLLKRGRAQGRLSLDEVRGAFEAAGISPAQGRSILRELSEAGISLAGDNDAVRKAVSSAAAGAAATEHPADHPAGADVPSPARKRPAKKTTARKTAAGTGAKSGARAGAGKAATGPAADEAFDVTEVEAAGKADAPSDAPDTADTAADAPADLDDQSTTMGDSVHTYLKAIGRRQLLTAEQEVDLAKRIEAGLYAEHKLETEEPSPALRIDLEWVAADGRRAKAHMLEANLRLVVSVAKKYSDRGLSLLDVVQEGNLGLIRAVEKFDYSKGYKFSTYAMWWIRQAIQRGFADSARTIRLPVHVLEMLSKLSRVERDMHQRLGREPTPEELAVELDKSPEQVRELLRTSRQPISLDSTIGEDGETRIGDLIEDTDSPEASELVDRQLMADQLRRTLDILSPREAKIMAMRFGLYDGTPRTLDEIGRALGLTRERIRQLEKESLSKLRHPSNARPLLDFAV